MIGRAEHAKRLLVALVALTVALVGLTSTVTPRSRPRASRAAMLVSTVANASKPAISVGTTIWAIVPAPAGQPAAIGVKAEVDVPDLKMHVSMIIRKNFDANLPASHTIDLRMNFDPTSTIKGVKDIALPLMRRDDPPAADALSGVRVKISDNYFLIGLNRGDADVARNVQEIGERTWFDFPMQLDDDRIAKLTFEKGAEGKALVLEMLTLSNSLNPVVSTKEFTAADAEIPLEPESGTFLVPVTINGALILKFTIDSGASDVSIPADVVSTLIRAGTISSGDFLGSETYKLADGSALPSERFVIRSLKVGNKLIENVVGSVAPMQGGLLLGQSFLGRFNKWSIDNKRNVLILN
jgi:predicted aspartyl protease